MEEFPKSDAFIQEIICEFPRFKIVPKAQSRLQRSFGVALTIITLGRQRDYCSRYHTILGSTLYVPSSWPLCKDLDRYILLRHERIHLRQFRRYGLAVMALLYLFPFFPIGLAWGRARIEWEAYTETLRATAEVYGLEAARNPQLHTYLITQFTSGAYGWMWPFPKAIHAWIEAALREIEQEIHAN